MISTIEAVMPVRLSGARERLTERRLNLFLDSLSHFWDEPVPLRLTIAGIKDELHRLRQLTRGRTAAEIAVIDERELIDHPEIMRTSPWNKQMFIKLLFARLCSADAYLYLDADVVCVGRLRRWNFIQNGKAVSDWEPKSAHPMWWPEPRRLLGKMSTDRSMGLAVTPKHFFRCVGTTFAILAVGFGGGLMLAKSAFHDQPTQTRVSSSPNIRVILPAAAEPALHVTERTATREPPPPPVQPGEQVQAPTEKQVDKVDLRKVEREARAERRRYAERKARRIAAERAARKQMEIQRQEPGIMAFGGDTLRTW